MSIFATDVHADQFVVSAFSKTEVDALRKAFECGGQVQVKCDPGGGTKRYFGLVKLANSVAATVADGDYLLRNAEGLYTEVVPAAVFTAGYTLTEESS